MSEDAYDHTWQTFRGLERPAPHRADRLDSVGDVYGALEKPLMQLPSCPSSSGT
jgi:hypothetical protein